MQNLREWWNNLKTSDRFNNKLQDLSDRLRFGIACLALLIVALLGDTNLAWQWLYAGVLTTILTQAGKVGFDYTHLGERPDGGDKSMPSGHTSAAFFGGWFILVHWGWVAGIIGVIFASFVGFQRIFADAHYLRDVIAGSLLALACVGAVYYADLWWTLPTFT